MKSQDVEKVTKHDGTRGALVGKKPEQIYRAHHNLNLETGEPLPGFTVHDDPKLGCQCDDCVGYLKSESGTERAPDEASMTTYHVQFLNSRGFRTDTVADAQVRYDKMSPDEQRLFLADFSAWKQRNAIAA